MGVERQIPDYLNPAFDIYDRYKFAQQRIADHAAEVAQKDGILREILLFAIHGCGTKQKDARGKQFAAIVDLCSKAGITPDQQLQPKGEQG